VWAEQNGVDLTRVIVIETRLMEEAYQTVLDFISNRAIDLVVVDSFPALIPATEDEKDVEEATVGRGALVTNKFFRKMGQAIKRSLTEQERPCTGLMINQWREKIGVMKGDPRTTPGGKGKDFSYYTRVSLRRTDWIEEKQETVGLEVTAVTIKNKSAPARRTAAVDFYFDGKQAGKFDVVKDMMNTALYMGIIKRAGAYYRFGDEQWQGKDGTLQALREDLDLRRQVCESTIHALGNVSTDPRVTEDDDE
jgi:recombination protein RecA